MAPNAQCAALAAAKEKKGLSWGQIAGALGQSEQHVIDIVTGQSKPTEAEFNAIAKVLGITSSVRIFTLADLSIDLNLRSTGPTHRRPRDCLKSIS
ncbi:hypothetical protein BDZ97DRAFT_1832556 [Flammula alnicola]|nr:hypothetical protein BDZ97DRAFT_1832556 [Flammula alnicola]